MTTRLSCPGCNKLLTIPDEVASSRLKCPMCGHIFAVPAAQDDAFMPQLAQTLPRRPVAREEKILSVLPADPSRSTDEILDVLPVRETGASARRAAGAPRTRPDFPPITFTAVATSDPSKWSKRSFEVTVTREGLRLVQKRKDEIRVPVGSPARYEGGNSFILTIDGRDTTLAVQGKNRYQQRLAADVVAFLKGKKFAPSRQRLQTRVVPVRGGDTALWHSDRHTGRGYPGHDRGWTGYRVPRPGPIGEGAGGAQTHCFPGHQRRRLWDHPRALAADSRERQTGRRNVCRIQRTAAGGGCTIRRSGPGE